MGLKLFFANSKKNSLPPPKGSSKYVHNYKIGAYSKENVYGLGHDWFYIYLIFSKFANVYSTLTYCCVRKAYSRPFE